MISDRCSRSSTPSPPCVHRLIFSFRLPLLHSRTHPPPRLLLSILKDHAARSRGYIREPIAADGLCAYHLRGTRLSSPRCCKGIFRCFSKFLQTGLMADDCVPKVTPGENEPSEALTSLVRIENGITVRSPRVFVPLPDHHPSPPPPRGLLPPFFPTFFVLCAHVCGVWITARVQSRSTLASNNRF